MKTDIFVTWYPHVDKNTKWWVVSDIPPKPDNMIAQVACRMQAVHIVALHNDWLEKVKDACGLNAVDAAIAEAVENIVKEDNNGKPFDDHSEVY